VRKPGAATTGIVRLFFGVFLLLGIGFFYTATIHPALQAAAALRWTETPCVIDSSRVAVHHSSSARSGPTYSIEVLYHYRYDGGTYTSDRFQFVTGSTAGKARMQRVVDQYPRGKQTVCYVNPSKPGEAVIHRGLNVDMAFGFLALPFALIGGFGLFFTGRVMGPQQTSQKNAMPTFVPASAEPVPLKPQSTPLGTFFVMLFFAVFWNGFVSVFFYLVFRAPGHASVPIVAKVFVGFFGLIGLLIAAGVIGSFRALFNPRILLSARTNAVPLGGEFQFQWNIRGRADKLHKIRMVLEGQEEAVSRRGKSVQTFTQVFAEIPIFETMDNETLSQGQNRVTIPAGLMHSFNGRHNKVLWRIRVRAEVPHSPGIEESFPIDVLPHAATTT
jgi:hypothetical protein